MGKDNGQQPAFNTARTLLDEFEKQAERWVEYSVQQAGEAAKVARAIRAQTISATKAMLDTAETFSRSGS